VPVRTQAEDMGWVALVVAAALVAAALVAMVAVG